MNGANMSGSAQKNEQGFTLIELVITMALGLMILAAMFTFLIEQRKYYAVQEQVAEMVQGARAAMDMLTREIQMAGYNPAGAAFYGITYSTSQLQIQSDSNGNGNTNDSNENIVYSRNTEKREIVRSTSGGAPQPFAENVDAFNFDYLDANGNITTTSANIRQVRITFTVRTSKPDPLYKTNGGYRTYTLTSLVTPRNLGL